MTMLGIKLCRGSALLALQRVDIERYLYADRSSETFVPVVSPTCVAWAWAQATGAHGPRVIWFHYCAAQERDGKLARLSLRKCALNLCAAT